MHYTPHVDLAFNSVEHIMRDVEGGWLLRYMHANGANQVTPERKTFGPETRVLSTHLTKSQLRGSRPSFNHSGWFVWL
ncbi:hypothetical protein MTR67_018826 [Solanum verrucosum]|uniref:Cytochrome b/b6 N-terminal region profile domain-containing protein n=1 Tax=Solanum verrucosum TaxID=315347 RepID=A0AAF0QLE7_SOLVR|nr:hypothetical protein MTR67_018826 [Solanum verrucosum]